MLSIKVLKNLLVSATNLSQPLDYFFDLMQNMELRSAGKKLNHERIQESYDLALMIQSLEKIISDFLGKKTAVRHPLLTFLPEEQFLHGTCAIDATVMRLPILYFLDLKMGIFAFNNLKGTKMFRFSGRT